MTARAAPSAARTTTPPKNIAELIASLGGIPPKRIRMNPPPGTATQADLEQHAGPMCGLIDGTLVEKAMGNPEAFMVSASRPWSGNTSKPRGWGSCWAKPASSDWGADKSGGRM